MAHTEQFNVESLFHTEYESLFRLTRRLGATTTFVLLRLCDEYRRCGKCFSIRQDRLSKDLSLPVRAVRREIRKLQYLELIQIAQGGFGSPSQYKLNLKTLRSLLEDGESPETDVRIHAPVRDRSVPSEAERKAVAYWAFTHCFAHKAPSINSADFAAYYSRFTDDDYRRFYNCYHIAKEAETPQTRCGNYLTPEKIMKTFEEEFDEDWDDDRYWDSDEYQSGVEAMEQYVTAEVAGTRNNCSLTKPARNRSRCDCLR